MKFHTRPQLEGPCFEVVGMRPGFGEFRGSIAGLVKSSESDGVRVLPTGQKPRPRLHGCGSVADPQETRRSDKDEPARCRWFGEAVASWRTDRGLGSRRAARGDARSFA